MGYFTLEDLKSELSEAELIELTDDDQLGIINQTHIDWAIAKAGAEFDSYAGVVMEVPLSTVPEIAKQKSMTIGIYYLYSRKSAVPEVRSKNYDDAIAWLKAVVKGEAVIGAQTASEVAADETPQISSGTRRFTRDKMRGF